MAKSGSKKTGKSNVDSKVVPKAGFQSKFPLSPAVKWMIAGSLAVLAILLYAPSAGYDFVYDDDAVIKDNAYVKQGFEGLDEIWKTSYFKGFNENINARAYRPIPLSTLAIEYEFFGLNPKVHHTTNIILYGLTAFFLFLLMSRMLRSSHWILPLMTTFFFVVHPIHIEVVANIKSRDELLAFLNFVIAAWLLLKSVDSDKWQWLAAAFIFYSIALFSKESALTTLAVLPLMLWFFRDLPFRKIALRSAPFLVAAAFYLIVRSAIVGGINEGVTLTHLYNSLLAAEKFSQRVASNLYVLGLYFFKNIFPNPLLSDYSYSTIPLTNWADYRTWLSVFLYAGLIFVALRGLAAKWLPAFAIWHFFATVSIFSSVIVLNVSAYNDRFNYNPSLGVCLLIAWLLYRLIKAEARTTGDFLKKNILLLSIAGLIGLAGVVAIYAQMPMWKDRYALFAHDVRLAPNNARMLKNHGGSLARQAMTEKDPEKRKKYTAEATEYLERALKIYFRMGTGHTHLGNMYALQENWEAAEKAYRNALSIDSKSFEATTNLANVCYRTGRFEEAIQLMERLDKRRFSQNDYYLLYLAYAKKGDTEKANYYKPLAGK